MDGLATNCMDPKQEQNPIFLDAFSTMDNKEGLNRKAMQGSVEFRQPWVKI